MANRIGRAAVFVSMKLLLFAAIAMALLLADAASAAGGQDARVPRFEVASVKTNRAGGRTTRQIEPQRLTYLNITLGEFIQMAYGVRRYQIQGEDWITNNASPNRYDIVAKAAAPVSETELRHLV